MKGVNDNNKAIGLDQETGNEVMKTHYGRAKQSFLWLPWKLFFYLYGNLFDYRL